MEPRLVGAAWYGRKIEDLPVSVCKERHQEFRIFELDATDDPPSRMDVVIHDYNRSVGDHLCQAEVNFL
jgi:hypothetical protein